MTSILRFLEKSTVVCLPYLSNQWHIYKKKSYANEYWGRKCGESQAMLGLWIFSLFTFAFLRRNYISNFIDFIFFAATSVAENFSVMIWRLSILISKGRKMRKICYFDYFGQKNYSSQEDDVITQYTPLTNPIHSY